MRHKLKESLSEFEELIIPGELKKNVDNSENIDASRGMEEKELTEIRIKVRGIIGDALNYTEEQKNAVSYTDAFVEDLNMNSMDFISCLDEIENHYGIVIQGTDVLKLTNIEKASRYIYAARHELKKD